MAVSGKQGKGKEMMQGTNLIVGAGCLSGFQPELSKHLERGPGPQVVLWVESSENE